MAMRGSWMRVLPGAVQWAVAAAAAATGCGGEPGAVAPTALSSAAAVSRAAVAAAAERDGEPEDRPLQAPAAREALAQMSLADISDHLDGDDSDETVDLGAPRALLAHLDDAALPAEVLEHSGLDDLLLVMNAQAEHLRMSGEVVLCRAEDPNEATAQEVPAVLAELALSAQDAADALADVVSQVALGQDVFIPAAAVSANHTVVEKLSRSDAQRFSDTYIDAQLGTLRRAKKTLKQAFQVNPAYADVLDRAARRLNKAFQLFDFVREKASAAVADPVEAIRFGSGFVEQASELLHSDSDGDRKHTAGDTQVAAEPAAKHEAAAPHGQVAQLGEVAASLPIDAQAETRDAAKTGRRVRFSLDTEAPAAAAPGDFGQLKRPETGSL